MDLDEYIDRYGVNADDLALQLLRRVHLLDEFRRNELREVLGVMPAPAPENIRRAGFADLVGEASENLRLARKLRDSVTDHTGQIRASVSEVQKALAAADKALDTASKRWQDIYNTSTFIALEDSVKEVLQEVDEAIFKEFVGLLETRLAALR